MKKNVLTFGLIAGLIVAVMMIVSTLLMYNNTNYKCSMYVGYASMLLAFSVIFVAVKNYRDKYNNGVVTFGKALTIGLYITLIASTVYVVVWLIDYYIFIPDFMDKYAAYMIKKTKADGGTAQQISDQIKQMDSYKEMYKTPIFVILMTYMEILPVGLVITLISALILKRSAGKNTLATS